MTEDETSLPSGSAAPELRLPVAVWPALRCVTMADEFRRPGLPDRLDAERS